MSPVRQIMMYADPVHFKKLGLKPEAVISFAGGWVNHQAPSGLQKAYQEIIADDALMHLSGGCSPTLGLPTCREALVKYEQEVYGTQDLDADQIAIGASSTQLLADLLRVLLDGDDKILLLDPAYCNYQPQIVTATDSEIIRFPVLDVETWEYRADQQIDAFVDLLQRERPKMVLLTSPDNPTSQILSHRFVQAAHQAVSDYGGFLVMDFAYKDLVFDEDKIPEYFSWGPTDNFLSLHSNSKWSRSLGRRLGWLEAGADIIQALDSIQSSNILCPDTLHQMALEKYLNQAIKDGTLKSYIKMTAGDYRRAAEYSVEMIKKHLSVRFLAPQGGLFVCLELGLDGASFVEQTLKETGVLFVPGWGFGKTMKNGVRLSFGPLVHNLEKIEAGLERVGTFLRS